MATTTRIVILGGGFGGVYTTRHMERLIADHRDVSVTLVNRDNYLPMTPLLFEAGSGVLEPRHAVHPIRTLLRRTRFVEAEVERIDCARRLRLAALEYADPRERRGTGQRTTAGRSKRKAGGQGHGAVGKRRRTDFATKPTNGREVKRERIHHTKAGVQCGDGTANIVYGRPFDAPVGGICGTPENLEDRGTGGRENGAQVTYVSVV